MSTFLQVFFDLTSQQIIGERRQKKGFRTLTCVEGGKGSQDSGKP